MCAYQHYQSPSLQKVISDLSKYPEQTLSICTEFTLNTLTAYEVNRMRENAHNHDEELWIKDRRNKNFKTLAGELHLDYPRFENYSFVPSAFAYAETASAKLREVISELYLAGASDRDLSRILTEKICSVSRNWVSRAYIQEQENTEKNNLKRDLHSQDYLCLIVDSMYIENGVPTESGREFRKVALSYAMGLNATTGCWEALGKMILPSETALGYQMLFEDLKRRHIGEVFLVTSDFHKSFRVSIPSCFSETQIQRCIFHSVKRAYEDFVKELGSMLNRERSDKEGRLQDEITIAKLFRCFYQNSPNRLTTLRIVKPLLDELGFSEATQSKLLNYFGETLTYFQFPKKLWPAISNTNQIERSNEEIRRRTKVINTIPNWDALNRIANSILLEEEKEWESYPKGNLTEIETCHSIHKKLVDQVFEQAEAECEKYYMLTKVSLLKYRFDVLWCNCFSILLLIEDREMTLRFFTVHGVSGSDFPVLLLVKPIRNNTPEEFKLAADNLIERGINPKTIKMLVSSTLFTQDYESFTDCFENSELYIDPNFFLERFKTIIPDIFREELSKIFEQMYSTDLSGGIRQRLNSLKSFLKEKNLESGQNYLLEIEAELKRDLGTILSLKEELDFDFTKYKIPKHWEKKVRALDNEAQTPSKAIEGLIHSLKRKSYKTSSSNKN